MKTIRIISLYPKQMNLYGDSGNILTLQQRLKWRGIKTEVIEHNIGDQTDFSLADIVVGGGGQDKQQSLIQADLLGFRSQLSKLVDQQVPMLLICGAYQIFGRSFITENGEVISGLGILPIETKAGKQRLTGNIVIESSELGKIIGYENHSGQTILDNGAEPLGKVLLGAGNNARDKTEGLRYRNIIASYLHGPILPKNPQLADFLIEKALDNAGIELTLKPLAVDQTANKLRSTIIERNQR